MTNEPLYTGSEPTLTRASNSPSQRPAPYPAGGHERQVANQPEDGHGSSGHGSHRLMMIACCIPMLLIVGVLVATGVAGTGAIVYAAICLGIMAVMMYAMPGSKHH